MSIFPLKGSIAVQSSNVIKRFSVWGVHACDYQYRCDTFAFFSAVLPAGAVVVARSSTVASTNTVPLSDNRHLHRPDSYLWLPPPPHWRPHRLRPRRAYCVLGGMLKLPVVQIVLNNGYLCPHRICYCLLSVDLAVLNKRLSPSFFSLWSLLLCINSEWLTACVVCVYHLTCFVSAPPGLLHLLHV